jgi:hypothetical protein
MGVAAQGRLSMVWINEHKKVWRVAVLVLLLVAIMGPWAFDRVNVPSEYPCSPPDVRLEGDFCGLPVRGITVFCFMAVAFINISVELVTGATVLTDRAREFLFSMFLPLVVLPFVSTFLLILRGDRRRRQVFGIVTWGLATGVGLLAGVLVGLSSGLKYFWFLWGIWLYIGLAAIALVLEVLTLAVGKRLSQGE